MIKSTVFPELVSFILDDDAGAGHSYDYHRAVSQCANQLGWRHNVYLTERAQPNRHPDTWRTLSGVTSKSAKSAGILRRAFAVNLASRAIARVLDQPAHGPRIAFLESFSASHLVEFVDAFAHADTSDWHVWLLFRGIQNVASRTRNTLYRALLRILDQRVNGRLILLTDSSLLAADLSARLGRSVRTLPVPHAALTHNQQSPRATAGDSVCCWWPGAPRPEKGLEAIRYLTRLRGPAAQRLTILASSDAALGTASAHDGPVVREVATSLSREAYETLMFESEVILLPYDPAAYHSRTSGVFIEAVTAMRTPLTTSGTWMAVELAANGLAELALPADAWRRPQIADQILAVARDATIQFKLKALSESYAASHSAEAFALALETIWREQIQA